LKRLAPISPSTLPPQTVPSTEPRSVGRLSRLSLPVISGQVTRRPPSKLQPLPAPNGTILDLDIETVSAGFDDPEWVPQKITCVAWSWVGEDGVESRICGPDGLFGRPERRAEMLAALLEQIGKAGTLTGHNIARFDLRIINAEAMRLGLNPVRRARVQDTMRLVRAKGFKKGQDNLGLLLRVQDEKMALPWQAWQDAYDEDGWATIRQRCESDVVMHKQIRAELLSRGWLRPAVEWHS